MDEIDIQFVLDNWTDTFCLYDSTDPECPFCCIGADQCGLVYIYGAGEDEDMDWNLYTPKLTDRFFAVTIEHVVDICQLH